LGGGPGSYGFSSTLSYFYFDRELAERLNRKLAKFLNSSRRSFPDLDFKCLKTDADVRLRRPIQHFNQKQQKYQQPPPPKVMMSEPVPKSFTSEEGYVYKILDENYGLIAVKQWLALFDVCDLWLDPSTTASKAGSKLHNVLTEHQRVIFNAALVDERQKVQFLVSSVWSAQAAGNVLPDAWPRPIAPDSVNEKKKELYRTVVAAIAGSIPDVRANVLGQQQRQQPQQFQQAVSAPPPQANRGPDRRKRGRIRTIFVRRDVSNGQSVPVGGLINVIGGNICFFLKALCASNVYLAAGQEIFLNEAKLIETASPWGARVPCVALSVFAQGDVPENESAVAKKIAESTLAMTDVRNLIGQSPACLNTDGQVPGVVDLDVASQVAAAAKKATVQVTGGHMTGECLCMQLKQRSGQEIYELFPTFHVRVRHQSAFQIAYSV